MDAAQSEAKARHAHADREDKSTHMVSRSVASTTTSGGREPGEERRVEERERGEREEGEGRAQDNARRDRMDG